MSMSDGDVHDVLRAALQRAEPTPRGPRIYPSRIAAETAMQDGDTLRVIGRLWLIVPAGQNPDVWEASVRRLNEVAEPTDEELQAIENEQ